MALTIVKDSGSKLWARNPIFVVLETDNYQLTREIKPRFRITLSAIIIILPGDSYDFIFDGYTVNMEAVAASATPNENQFRVRAGGQGFTAWVDQFITDLLQNTYISSTFSGYQEVIVSNYSSSAYLQLLDEGLLQGYGSSGVANALPVTIETASVAATYRPNFSVRCELFVEENYRQGLYGAPKAVYALKPDSNNQVVFYADPVIMDYLTVDLPQVPSLNQLVKRCTEIAKQTWVRFTEQYGNPVVKQPFLPTLENRAFVLKAGVSDVVYTDLYDPEQAPDPDKRKFLTLHPDKKVFKDQPEWLYFKRDIAAINNIQIIVYYANGSSNTTTFSISNAQINAVSEADDVVIVEVGHDQLQLDAFPSISTITHWDVQLRDAANLPLYLPKRYTLKTTPSRFYRYFIYQNSLGAMDTLRTEGAIERKISTKRQKAYRAKQYNFEVPQRIVTNDKQSEETVYTVSTGHITKAEADYLDELLRSDYVYAYRNGRFEPILLEDGSWQVTEDSGIYGITFSYTAAYSEDIYMTYGDGQALVY